MGQTPAPCDTQLARTLNAVRRSCVRNSQSDRLTWCQRIALRLGGRDSIGTHRVTTRVEAGSDPALPRPGCGEPRRRALARGGARESQCP